MNKPMKLIKFLERENGQDFRKNDKTKQIQKAILSQFRSLNISIKIENERDYFDALVLFQALLNKQALEQCFENTRRELFEIWDHISYQERSTLLYHRVVDLLNELPSIKYQDQVIFIPFFDALLNALYRNELAILELPQYFKLYRQFEARMESVHAYGLNIYDESFIAVKNLITKPNLRIFYYHPLKSLYRIDDQFDLLRLPLNKLACQAVPLTKDLMFISKHLVQAEELSLVQACLESDLIGDKTKKQLHKYLNSLAK
jgi:hypothetical protein